MVLSDVFLFIALLSFDIMGQPQTITDGDTISLALAYYGFLGIFTCAIAVLSIVQVLLPFFQIFFPRLLPFILCRKVMVDSDIDKFSDAEPSSGTMNPKELDCKFMAHSSLSFFPCSLTNFSQLRLVALDLRHLTTKKSWVSRAIFGPQPRFSTHFQEVCLVNKSPC